MIERLKSEVLKKFGSELMYTKACRVLADEICTETGFRVSTTTIRRIFGFLKTSATPAKFTLSTLAIYVGYATWEEFCTSQGDAIKAPNKQKRNWNDLYEKSLEISKETYKLVIGQSGIPFHSVVSRSHAEERITCFLNSSKMATGFVAPGGFGKSSMLAKWFEKNWIRKQSDDVILFLNASFMLSFLNKDFRLDRWIQDQLDFAQTDTLKYFLKNPQDCEARIIFAIDALDEITYDNVKLERLFLQLKQFISSYKDSGKIKLIITSRCSTWEKFALPFVIKGNAIQNSWYELGLKVDSQDHQNLYPLSNDEIQHVIDGTINNNFSSKLSVNELSFQQKKMISNPFFLELFIKLYTPNKHYGHYNEQELLNEFLRNKVFYSRFSEEKMDILHGVLKLMEHGKSGTAAKKMELRDVFPIHLKTAGNYFNAYEELISYGLLTEFITINEHNTYCKYVKITSDQLFETLIGMDIVQQNGGVDFKLIQTVEEEYSGFEIKNRLISFLYTTAFYNGKHLELKNFFQLSDETLSDRDVIDTVLNSAIYSDDQQIRLMEHFVTQERAEKYLFRDFPDIYNVGRGDRIILEIFARKGRSKSVRIKSLSVLLLDSVFTLNLENTAQYYQDLNAEEIDSSCTSFDISIRLGSILIYNHFIDKESNEIEILKMFYYREMAYKQTGEYCRSLNGEFELILCLVLIYMKSFHKVLQLIDDVEHLYKTDKSKKSNLNYCILQCYKLSAQHSLGMEMSKTQVEFLKSCESEISASKNYFLQIFYHSFLSSVQFAEGNRTQVERHFNEALELCENANFGLCSSGILKKMAKYYNEWGEKTKESICLSEEKEILKNVISIFDTETLFV
ncbi:NACHT domain-containing protein [Labilibaculum antarcticum]|uniref:NACHT domain-containing protein n=1 Tax=Labilibaculum antarcticum TaxID=1717717 RepID=A0A1Y1CFK1_9BACT|nr:hypothetical protein [Labilibaculum antarcticum]BAX79148.1 hypothetical protein ALGA_0759 [Labilibaculum antarcticum]